MARIEYPVRVEDVDALIKEQEIPRGRLVIVANESLVTILDTLTGSGTGMYKGVQLRTDSALEAGEIQFEEEANGRGNQ